MHGVSRCAQGRGSRYAGALSHDPFRPPFLSDPCGHVTLKRNVLASFKDHCPGSRTRSAHTPTQRTQPIPGRGAAGGGGRALGIPHPAPTWAERPGWETASPGRGEASTGKGVGCRERLRCQLPAFRRLSLPASPALGRGCSKAGTGTSVPRAQDRKDPFQSVCGVTE